MLARVCPTAIEPADYWISEKLDGIRAYWDGQRLVTRNGNPIRVPDWFTTGWPAEPLDGELWLGRGTFERLMGLVHRAEPQDPEWRQVHYQVFDAPRVPGPFGTRLASLRQLLGQPANPSLQLVAQSRVPQREALRTLLAEVQRQGGEGLMLHRDSALYQAGRSEDLLKLKPYQDAEARVIAHLPGRGRFRGMLGALLVETEKGIHFRIGTGFSDAERSNPPPLGSVVTFRYRGTSAHGTPRFASFLRMRDDL
jgi:DNA ligase-1